MVQATFGVACPSCQDPGAEVDVAYPHIEPSRLQLPIVTMFRCAHQNAAWHDAPTDAELCEMLPDSAFDGGHRPPLWNGHINR